MLIRRPFRYENFPQNGSCHELTTAHSKIDIARFSFIWGFPIEALIPIISFLHFFLHFVLFFYSLTEIPVPGVTNGKQFVKIADNLEKADMMQLLAYTLGMYNTFRRPDRDSFVNIMYDNIKDGTYIIQDRVPGTAYWIT